MTTPVNLFENIGMSVCGKDVFKFFVEIDVKSNNSKIICRKNDSKDNIIIFKIDNGIIRDASLIIDGNDAMPDGYMGLVWVIDNNHGLSGIIYYAEINNSLIVVKQDKLRISTYPAFISLPKAFRFNNYVFICWVDHLKNKAMCLLYSLLDKMIRVEDVSDNKVHSSYLSLLGHRHTRNLTLVPSGNGRAYLQYISCDGEICTFCISILKNSKVAIDLLFKQYAENIGYHQTLMDQKSRTLVTVFSENGIKGVANTNDIYIFTQRMFNENDINISGGAERVNQTKGFYVRPQLCLSDDRYYIFWESDDSINYTSIDIGGSIVTPESSMHIDTPVNLSCLSTEDGIIICSQIDNWATLDLGTSLDYANITLN